VLKEIRCLAKIKSDHVVNYNHSWIEVILKVILNIKFRIIQKKNLTENQIKVLKLKKIKKFTITLLITMIALNLK
jgi:hypothetical protein